MTTRQGDAVLERAVGSMNSSDKRASDQLDILIRQALVESVKGEEPPARIWERIHVQLTRSSDRRPSVRWLGPMFQAAALVLFLVLGSVSLRPERPVEQQRLVMPSQTLPTATRMLRSSTRSNTSAEDYAVTAVDKMEITLLREYSSSQTRTSITAELWRRTSGIVIPVVDVPPHPNSPQAKALHPRSSQEAESIERPVYTPGVIWQ